MAERYLANQIAFVGLTDDELDKLADKLNVIFTTVFRAFLKHFGKKHCCLFTGSDAEFTEYRDYLVTANKLLAQASLPELPAQALVFLLHQGYSFNYFIANGDYDSPVYSYAEGEGETIRFCDANFLAYLDSTIKFTEKLFKLQVETGGYYIIISEQSISHHYPALVRPIDEEDHFI